MENKICVYAICKNEIAFVDKWLDSMSEADCIVVLDTGSTDGTYEKLKADKRVTKVKQKEIKPWRFDVARNESMKLVPKDCNILVCTDFDECFEPGWARNVKANWKEDTTVIHYLYTWNHTAEGDNLTDAVYMKIHARDLYYWKYPVHEMLVPHDGVEENVVELLDGQVHLHHWQDLSKPRKYYFELLELGVKENPEDAYMRTFLGREYLFQDKLKEGLEQYQIALTLPDIYDEKRPVILLDALLYMASAYETLEDYENALKYCEMFIRYRADFRDPYFFMGEVYNMMGLYTLAEACVLAGFKYGVNHHTFIEKYGAWLGWGYILLGYIYLNMGRKEEAAKNLRLAISYDPNNKELTSALKSCII